MATRWPDMDRTGPRVDQAAVQELEAYLGVSLPDDYARFLLEVNGGRTSKSFRVFDICTHRRPNSTILNSMNSLAEPDESRDLRTAREASHWLPPEVLPIGYDDGGGNLVLGIEGEHKGEVWFLDGVNRRPGESNPRVTWFDRRDVCRVAMSFTSFLEMLRPLRPVG